ncbi:MAG: hypothetical protein SGILL_000161 [Bacillariaceae sp.]
MSAAAPPPPTNLPPPPPMTTGGGPPPPGGMPFTNTVLITSAPSFLHSFHTIREWLYACGSIRTAVFYPRAKRYKGDDDDEAAESKDDAGDAPSTSGSSAKKITALVTFSHPDAAVKFIASFQKFSGRLDERYSDMDTFMVPNPNAYNIPLPPAVVDDETSTVLGAKLWENFVGIESSSSAEAGDKKTTQDGSTNGATAAANKDVVVPAKAGDDEKDKVEVDENKLDASKAAAAAGGAYDVDEDPLNAPHVLEAVKAFRRGLETTQTFQQKRRIELVQQKLKSMRPRVEAQMMEERELRKQQKGGQAVPPPPLPTGLPPPQTSLLPPPPMPPAATAAASDSGKRGRSNLPAWMTQQKAAVAAAGDEPPSKKAKTYPTNFPALSPATHGALSEFLTNKVKESLGEEEKSLVDFLYSHILQGKATSELLQELKMVLEEESESFLQTVWAKVTELEAIR